MAHACSVDATPTLRIPRAPSFPLRVPVAPPASLREHARAKGRTHALHVPPQSYRPTVRAADGQHRGPPRTRSLVTVTSSHTVIVASSAASIFPLPHVSPCGHA